MKNSTLLALATVAALTGCGGGGGGDSGSGGGSASGAPSAAEQVPASASQSVSGFVDYLLALFKTDADKLEPVDVSAVTPVQSDDAPPAVID